MMRHKAGDLTVLQGCLAMLIGGVLIGELLIYSPPAEHAARTLGVSVKAVHTAPQLTSLQLEIAHGSADRELSLVAFPLSNRTPRRSSVFVFNDSSYPIANVIPRAVQGIFDHLSGELIVHGSGPAPTNVTGVELKDVLMAVGDANQRAIVMMTGVLPSTVFSATVDLLSPWVEAGGLIIWGGAAIGFWSGVSGKPLSGDDAPGENGTQRLLGTGIIRYPTGNNRLGGVPSDFATALNISYQLTSSGVLRDSVLARGGIALGWYGGTFSSISYLPRGSGGYLIFGGEILDEASVAVDLARLLMAGAIYASGAVAVKRLDLSQIAPSSVLDWDLPFAAPHGLMFVAFDPNPDGVFFTARTIAQ